MNSRPFSFFREALRVLFLLCGSGLFAGARPNIVLILADDLGWNGVSCFGNEHVATPHLDRLAAEGMKFSNAYVMSQCLPTRAAFFSGQYDARTRLTAVEKASPSYAPMISPGRADGLPPETFTVFEMLREAGYATGMSGKWHLSDAYDSAGLLEKKGMAYFDAYGLDFVGPADGKSADKAVAAITDDMLGFIEAHREGPFIAYLAHHAVHTPLAAPDAVTEKHVKRGYRRSSTRNGEFEERVVAEYLAMIEHLDASVGRVTAKLGELGLAENTLIIFLSDNGGLSRVWDNHPLRGGKGQLYEGGIRVPMIVRWPARVKAGGECAVPVQVVDLYPTFMEVAGGAAEKGQILDGVSIVPLFDGGTSLAREAIFSHHPEYVIAFAKAPCSMIRKGDYKLIHYFGDYLDPEGCIPRNGALSGRFVLGARTELFNVREDLSESRDLASEMPQKAAELMADLRAWWKDTDAQFPKPNPKMDRSKWIWNRE